MSFCLSEIAVNTQGYVINKTKWYLGRNILTCCTIMAYIYQLETSLDSLQTVNKVHKYRTGLVLVFADISAISVVCNKVAYKTSCARRHGINSVSARILKEKTANAKCHAPNSY